jgi:CO/xanthine dehydrogenase Mo-binding subunit
MIRVTLSVDGHPQRPALADIVLGTKPYLVDVSVPGMMHGRVLRPPTTGAVPLAVNENSLRAIPGARIVHVNDFLAVVAMSEWDAIRAVNTLKITWSQPRAPFPSMEDIDDYIRMSSSCAVCDFRGDTATVWTGSQKPHTTAQGVATLLQLPLENVRAIRVSGPGSYGRNDAGDAAMDAALLSKAVNRPVRVR